MCPKLSKTRNIENVYPMVNHSILIFKLQFFHICKYIERVAKKHQRNQIANVWQREISNVSYKLTTMTDWRTDGQKKANHRGMSFHSAQKSEFLLRFLDWPYFFYEFSFQNPKLPSGPWLGSRDRWKNAQTWPETGETEYALCSVFNQPFPK